MVSCYERQVDFCYLENFLPEFTYESGVTVRDDSLRRFSVFKHIGKVSSCLFLYCKGRFAGNKLDVFGELVCDRK